MPPTRGQLWAGRALSGLLVATLMLSASLKLMHAPAFVATWTGHLGYTETSLTTIGILELACALAYAVPQTSLLGGVLLTGYLGGAIATHVRVGDAFLMPLVLGVLVWLGLYLRNQRVREVTLTAPRSR
jgi:hypothetical protein